jgi:hypothetical protein
MGERPQRMPAPERPDGHRSDSRRPVGVHFLTERANRAITTTAVTANSTSTAPRIRAARTSLRAYSASSATKSTRARAKCQPRPRLDSPLSSETLPRTRTACPIRRARRSGSHVLRLGSKTGHQRLVLIDVLDREAEVRVDERSGGIPHACHLGHLPPRCMEQPRGPRTIDK